MATNEIKVNLDLMGALIKLREASVIFDQQAAIISEKKRIGLHQREKRF